MNHPKLTACIAALTLGLAARSEATVNFHNTGTISSGWNYTNLDSPNSLSDSTSQVYKGTTSIKSSINYIGTSYTGRYHAMKGLTNVYHIGSTGFYGFAFFLQSAWDFQNQMYTIFQFIGDFNNTGCDDMMPTTMVWLQGNQLTTRRKSGSVCAQVTTKYSSLATVSAGVWHRIVIQANWQTGSSGYLKLWYDGTKVLEALNVATTISDSANRYYRMDVGLYADSWHDDKKCLGATNRYAYFDQIGWGTAFADADPSAW